MDIFKIFGKFAKRKINNVTLDLLEKHPEVLEQLNNEELDKLILENANKYVQAKHDLNEYQSKLQKLHQIDSSMLDIWLSELEQGVITQQNFDSHCFDYEVKNYEYKSVTEIIEVLKNVIQKFDYVNSMLKQQQTLNNINMKMDSYSCTMAKYDLELTKIKFKKSITSYDNIFKSRTDEYKKEKEVLELINEEPIKNNLERINYLKSI
jgi:hypothetical protein